MSEQVAWGNVLMSPCKFDSLIAPMVGEVRDSLFPTLMTMIIAKGILLDLVNLLLVIGDNCVLFAIFFLIVFGFLVFVGFLIFLLGFLPFFGSLLSVVFKPLTLDNLVENPMLLECKNSLDFI